MHLPRMTSFIFYWSLFLGFSFIMSIGSGNGLASNRHQAITWTNADPVQWRIYASLMIEAVWSTVAADNHGICTDIIIRRRPHPIFVMRWHVTGWHVRKKYPPQKNTHWIVLFSWYFCQNLSAYNDMKTHWVDTARMFWKRAVFCLHWRPYDE